jgi:hypothetical protein
VGLAVVRDLRERRAPASPEEIEAFETDVLAGFILARASAGLDRMEGRRLARKLARVAVTVGWR